MRLKASLDARPKQRARASEAACPAALPPVGDAAEACPLRPKTQDAGVGQSLGGDDFVWQTEAAEAFPLRPETQDACVGESLGGGDLMWQAEVAQAFPLRPETQDACVGESL